MSNKDGKLVGAPLHRCRQRPPEISGWQRATPTGERMAMPVPFSKADYTMGNANVNVKMVPTRPSIGQITHHQCFSTAAKSNKQQKNRSTWTVTPFKH